jgi:hypothetical protein
MTTLYELLDNYYVVTKNKPGTGREGVVALSATVESDWTNSLPRSVSLSIKGWQAGVVYEAADKFDRPVGIARVDRKTHQITVIEPHKDARLDDWNNVMKAYQMTPKEVTA